MKDAPGIIFFAIVIISIIFEKIAKAKKLKEMQENNAQHQRQAPAPVPESAEAFFKKLKAQKKQQEISYEPAKTETNNHSHETLEDSPRLRSSLECSKPEIDSNPPSSPHKSKKRQK